MEKTFISQCSPSFLSTNLSSPHKCTVKKSIKSEACYSFGGFFTFLFICLFVLDNFSIAGFAV